MSFNAFSFWSFPRSLCLYSLCLCPRRRVAGIRQEEFQPLVILAQAGIQLDEVLSFRYHWIPACAGMTGEGYWITAELVPVPTTRHLSPVYTGAGYVGVSTGFTGMTFLTIIRKTKYKSVCKEAG